MGDKSLDLQIHLLALTKYDQKDVYLVYARPISIQWPPGIRY
jgi:hypothetical protein